VSLPESRAVTPGIQPRSRAIAEVLIQPLTVPASVRTANAITLDVPCNVRRCPQLRRTAVTSAAVCPMGLPSESSTRWPLPRSGNSGVRDTRSSARGSGSQRLAG
jgi:hypothetical protein